MARPYRSEMAELSVTLDWVRSADISDLVTCLERGKSRPVFAVGSGGSLSAAYHLARLHRTLALAPSSAMTPYQFRTEPIQHESHCWVFSAGGSNVDVVAAVSAARRAEMAGVNVVTVRSRSALSRVASSDPAVRFHHLGIPSKKDGFLATNSLLAFCAVTTRAYLQLEGRDQEWYAISRLLEENLFETNRDCWREAALSLAGREHMVVLHDASTSLGAFDLESKLIEAGIAGVQLADYRHFAHGRHHWLAKNGSNSGVLAFVSDADRSLARRTIRLLPADVPTAVIDIPGECEAAQLTSVLAAFHVTEALGFARGIDPGQPGVPDFGRKLFRLPLGKPQVRSRSQVSIARKERQRPTPKSPDLRQSSEVVLAAAYRAFEENLANASLGGIVFDYDGTIVDTPDRFQSPRGDVTAELVRILRGGLPLGIATGRGRSAGSDLRQVIPKDLWSLVTVGYYNGAEIRELGDAQPLAGVEPPAGPLALLHDQLRGDGGGLTLTLRRHQLTIQAEGGLSEEGLWEIVQTVVAEQGLTSLHVVRSSHSIDVVDSDASKLNVVAAVASHAKTNDVLRIGDRGCWPGNDHEMLASPLGLSVEQVSPDLTSCWNIAPEALRGSRATLYYLRSVEVQDGLGRFRVEGE